jgi:hypothetical protein
MGRPPKKLDTPELKNVAKSKAALDRAEAAAKKRREQYEKDVITALEDNGLRTIAKVADVTTRAIKNVQVKHGVTSPRA